MPRKKVNFVKTKKVKKGDFKGFQKGVKTKKMSEKRALKKQEKGQGFIQGRIYGSNPVEMSPYKMGHSPAEMGHSPAEMGYSPMKNQNKGYAKQERKDLMQDMPIVKDAMGGRSWMSKHSKSALHMGHSPAEMGHESPAKMHGGDHGDDKKLENMKKKTAAFNELRRQRGDFGDIPANPSANPKTLSGDDSKKIANMKRKLKALNELRRQKGHFNKK